MFTNTKNWLKGATALLAVAVSTTGWAVPLDNRLYPIVDAGSPYIGFTDIAVEYKPGRSKKRGGGGDTGFTALSTSTTTFELQGPGYWGDTFSGTFELNATITPKGTFRTGWVDIYSSDALFGFGTEEVCNKQGKNCNTQPINGLVYSADLSAFGWSGTEGVLEFRTTNPGGLMTDIWNPAGTDERLIFWTDPFDLNGASSVHSFTAMADGIAILPVPAAVWLFGSGLLGLVGIARRKRA